MISQNSNENGFFHFQALVKRHTAALRYITQHAMSRKVVRKWGTKCLKTMFPFSVKQFNANKNNKSYSHLASHYYTIKRRHVNIYFLYIKKLTFKSLPTD